MRKILLWDTTFKILEREVFVEESPVGSGYLHMLSLPDNKLLFSYAQKFYLLENQKLTWVDKVKFFADKMVCTKKGRIMIPSHGGKLHGLITYESIDSLKKGLYNKFVTRSLRDQDIGRQEWKLLGNYTT